MCLPLPRIKLRPLKQPSLLGGGLTAMAQARAEEKLQENPYFRSPTFKFNAHAPEFVPRSQNQMPVSGYIYPYFQILDGSVAASDWFYVNGDQEPCTLLPTSNASPPNCSKNVLNDDLQQKIAKQVEYLFSDLSLLSNDAMMKHVAKDPEGYVPIPTIASMKKIKALINNNHNLVVLALRSSSKLILSADCKKVKRRIPFTESYKENLQCRTVVAENLPEDHSYQNLEKIFSRVGSVKAIRLCHPQEANASRPKTDVIVSNKLHALVEFDSPNVAERAAEQLSDERNWRKGLRVRVLMRCSLENLQPRVASLKTRKSGFDAFADDEEWTPSDQSPDDSSPRSAEVLAETNGDDNSSIQKKAPVRGRGKPKGRGQVHNERGLLSPPAQQSGPPFTSEPLMKQMNKGPRMPDGTRGFTMGRGKPLRSMSAVGCYAVE